MTLLFPHLFPFGRGDLCEHRVVSIGMEEYIKYVLSLSHHRFSKDRQFLLTYFDILNKTAALKSMGVFAGVTAGSYNSIPSEELEAAHRYQQLVDAAKARGEPVSSVPRPADVDISRALSLLRTIEVGDAAMPTSNGMRKAALVQLYSYWYRFGAPSLFLTFTPDDCRSSLRPYAITLDLLTLSIMTALLLPRKGPRTITTHSPLDAGFVSHLRDTVLRFVHIVWKHFDGPNHIPGGLQEILIDSDPIGAQYLLRIFESFVRTCIQ